MLKMTLNAQLKKVRQFGGCLLRTPTIILEGIRHGTDGIPRMLFNILKYIFLGSLCVIIDNLIAFPVISNNDYSRALVDNIGHALIGGTSWLVVVGIHKEGVLQAVSCAMMSSLIDLDHFVMARSFQLKGFYALIFQDAISPQQRPPLHATTIVAFVVPVLQVWCAQSIPCLHYLPYMFTVAVVSHHLRDANRRGLWFWPLGNTPPLPYGIYIACVMILPVVARDVSTAIDNEQISDGDDELQLNGMQEEV